MRCPSELAEPTVRCDRPAGHPGIHGWGLLTWHDAPGAENATPTGTDPSPPNALACTRCGLDDCRNCHDFDAFGVCCCGMARDPDVSVLGDDASTPKEGAADE